MEYENKTAPPAEDSADIICTSYGVLCPDGIERVSDNEYYDSSDA